MHVYFESVKVSVLLFPALVIFLSIPLFILHKRWYGELHEYRAFVFLSFVFYLSVAFLLTVLPLPADSESYCTSRAGARTIQFVPFMSFYDIKLFAEKHDLGWSIGGMLSNLSLWQIILNTLLLLPLGFFMRALYGFSFKEALLVSFSTSLFFEITQWTAVWGLADCPYRIFDVDDLITNTIGGGLGWLFLRPFFFLPNPNAPESEMWYKKNKK